MGLCEAIFAENPDLPVFGTRVLGGCPYAVCQAAVASTGGVDVLSRALVADQLGLA